MTCAQIGLVIGKKGSILQEIIASTTAAIKISQNSQLYPGTADRTISIRGSTEVMLVALDRIIQRIIEVTLVSTSMLLSVHAATLPHLRHHHSTALPCLV